MDSFLFQKYFFTAIVLFYEIEISRFCIHVEKNEKDLIQKISLDIFIMICRPTILLPHLFVIKKFLKQFLLQKLFEQVSDEKFYLKGTQAFSSREREFKLEMSYQILLNQRNCFTMNERFPQRNFLKLKLIIKPFCFNEKAKSRNFSHEK